MNKSQQAFAVTAICLSIILAGAIIAYRPGVEPVPEGPDYRFPGGVGTSMGFESFTYQGTDPQAKTISVSGSGSASATANQATVSLGVQTEDKEASEAIDENAVKMDAIITALMNMGFTEDDLHTTTYTIYPNYNYEIRQVTGYTVTNMIQITIDDLDMVGAVIDAAGAEGANRVDGVSFELDPETRETLKMQAYEAALDDAQAKAGVIVEKLELTITGVQSVSESSYSPARTYGMEEAYDMVSSKAPTPIIEGSQTVTVSVHIVYLID